MSGGSCDRCFKALRPGGSHECVPGAPHPEAMGYAVFAAGDAAHLRVKAAGRSALDRLRGKKPCACGHRQDCHRNPDTQDLGPCRMLGCEEAGTCPGYRAAP